MKILFAGFKGKNNSSKLLLDAMRCNENNKIYLTNSYKASESQLIKQLQEKEYDCAVIFGQWKRVAKNTLRLETTAKKGRYAYQTDFPYTKLAKNLQNLGYMSDISNFAGRWLCNNIYFYGLRHLAQTESQCKMIFIHLPKDELVDNYAKLAQDLMTSIEKTKL